MQEKKVMMYKCQGIPSTQNPMLFDKVQIRLLWVYANDNYEKFVHVNFTFKVNYLLNIQPITK